MHKKACVGLALSLFLLLSIILAGCAAETLAPQSVVPPEPTVAPPTQLPATPVVAANASEQAQVVTFVLVSAETTAGYSIEETFINDNNRLNTAIGTTNVVTGEFTLNYADPAASTFGQFLVDISTLRSDQTRRDRAIRTRWLESNSYPLAAFDVTEVRNFPADPQEGKMIQFQLVGDMKVKETTRQEVWDVAATLQGDRLSGNATLATTLESYNIPIPSILGILSVTDGITLTLDFVFERQAD